MNRERLTLLADFLDTLPPERFEYGTWVGSDWKGDPDLSCGTTACALGWATTISELRALGLRLERIQVDWHPSSTVGVVTHPDVTGDAGGPSIRSLTAGAIVFELQFPESEFLFLPGIKGNFAWRSPEDDATPHEVAEHLRRFLREF